MSGHNSAPSTTSETGAENPAAAEWSASGRARERRSSPIGRSLQRMADFFEQRAEKADRNADSRAEMAEKAKGALKNVGLSALNAVKPAVEFTVGVGVRTGRAVKGAAESVAGKLSKNDAETQLEQAVDSETSPRMSIGDRARNALDSVTSRVDDLKNRAENKVLAFREKLAQRKTAAEERRAARRAAWEQRINNAKQFVGETAERAKTWTREQAGRVGAIAMRGVEIGVGTAVMAGQKTAELAGTARDTVVNTAQAAADRGKQFVGEAREVGADQLAKIQAAREAAQAAGETFGATYAAARNK